MTELASPAWAPGPWRLLRSHPDGPLRQVSGAAAWSREAWRFPASCAVQVREQGLGVQVRTGCVCARGPALCAGREDSHSMHTHRPCAHVC